ncbi:hypothetical protein [Actinomadura macrotermitis]|uniref:Uncharacterized protein n=1 Tax=Actinomadura macrotermitis TaxID=2585200 RepID=A0A7K0C4E0_9ACTN|nr:hypothetical protein [Actinomadura macrotermitis]MQY08226.1 hypothetical protein [Actinomadura macrotermitis]
MIGSVLVAAGVAVHAVRLRRRVAGLPRVPAAAGGPLRWDAATGTGDYTAATAAGAALPAPARRSATAYARRHRLQVLDLVPADLPVERALDLARTVDPAGKMADGRGAGFALLARTALLERSGERAQGLDPGAFGMATVRLRRCAAPGAEGLAVVPCRTTPRGHACRGRRSWLRGLGVAPSRAVAGSVAGYAAVLAAIAADPAWGPAPALAYCAAPYLVFARTPLRPRDLHRAALLRLVRTPWTWWATLTDPPVAPERDREQVRHRCRPEPAGRLAVPLALALGDACRVPARKDDG